MRRLLACGLLVATVALAAAGLSALEGGRRARDRQAEAHALAAAGAAAITTEIYLDALRQALVASASLWERGAAGAAPVGERLEALYRHADQFRIVTLSDEDGQLLGPPILNEDPAALPGRSRHPRASRDEVAAHLDAVPREAATMLGWAIGEPFVRGERGPFVIVAASFKVTGESHATGDPCHSGARHVLAAEIGLDYLAAQLRIAGGAAHAITLLDGHRRVLAGGAPLAEVPGLDARVAPQGRTVRLAPPGGAPTHAAVYPVPRYGWIALARPPAGRAPGAAGRRLHLLWLGGAALAALALGLALARRP